MSDHPRPSPAARELVSGGYDPHVHIAPDVMERRIDDLALARRFHERRLAGFVLKSHYVPTAERASVVKAAVPGVDAVGAITLNASVGGLNPIAVEIAAREGARWVWLPTVDCRNQRESHAADPPGAKPPMWARLQRELHDEGIASPPIDVVDAAGEVTGALRDVLRVVAKHDLVLATGHLSRDEIFAVVDAATAAGVRRVVVTHPEFTSQRISPADQRELAARGTYLERCFTTAHTGKCTWDTVFDGVRAATPARSFFASDLGQPFNPPVEDGLALMADRFLAAGFTEEEVHTMAVTNTVALAGPTS
ncbi:MAG TPA: DUF6282 family protein [Streptosporangiaceae bacterium]|nr:DUF6282 family protein [Streptosporangiaceae bacterium]